MDCSQITAGLIAAQCGKTPIKGTNGKVYLISYEDINRDEALTVVTNNVISELALKSTKSGYLFESLEDSAVGEIALAKGKYMNQFDHKLPLRIFTKSEPAKAFVNGMTDARIVAIVENKEMGTAGEIKYEAYGWDAGLVLTELKSTTEYADGVAYELTLASDDSKEYTLPKSVFTTSGTVGVSNLEATEAMLTALL